MSELTPTQRVQAQLEKRYHQTDCDLKWKDTVKLLNDLAAELESETEHVYTVKANLVSVIRRLVKERDDLKRQLEQSQKDTSFFREHLVERTMEVNALKRQVEELEEGSKMMSEFHQDNIKLRAENAELERVHKSDNEAMVAALMCLREHNIEFGSNELIQRLDEIDQLRVEHTLLKAQNDSLDRELTRRDNENASLQNESKLAASAMAKLTEEFNQLQSENAELKQQLVRLIAKPHGQNQP